MLGGILNALHIHGGQGCTTHLIVDAGFSVSRGVVAFVPWLDESLGVLWNS